MPPTQEFLISSGHEDAGISRNADGDTPLHLAVETSEAVAELLASKFPRCIAWKNKAGADTVRPPSPRPHPKPSHPESTHADAPIPAQSSTSPPAPPTPLSRPSSSPTPPPPPPSCSPPTWPATQPCTTPPPTGTSRPSARCCKRTRTPARGMRIAGRR